MRTSGVSNRASRLLVKESTGVTPTHTPAHAHRRYAACGIVVVTGAGAGFVPYPPPRSPAAHGVVMTTCKRPNFTASGAMVTVRVMVSVPSRLSVTVTPASEPAVSAPTV